MAALRRVHLALVWGMAALAAAMLPAISIVIIYDVALRDLGYQPPAWPNQLVEYAMLYIAVLSAPLITREKAHVFIGSIRAAVPPVARDVMEKLACTACTVVCGFMSWYLFLYTRRLYLSGIADAKEFDMPRWLVIGPACLGFTLMTIEFLRFLIGRESMYREDGTRL